MTCMALAHCILGKFLGVVCHPFPLINIYKYIITPTVGLRLATKNRGIELSKLWGGKKRDLDKQLAILTHSLVVAY